MQYALFMLLAPLSLVISVGVLAVAHHRRGSSPATALMVLMVAVAGWLVFNTLELAAASPRMTLFWAKICYIFIVAAPVAWLVFALQYAQVRMWSRPVVIWLTALIPLITVSLVWVESYQWLVWRDMSFRLVDGFLALNVEHGPWFWVHAITSYLMMMIGAGAIVVSHFRSGRLYRKQSRWLVFGSLIPVGFNLTYVLDLIPNLEKDYTPIAFALAGLAFAVGMFWHRLFDVRPIARATLIDRIEDPVITLDAQDRIIDLNPAADRLLMALDPAESAVADKPTLSVTELLGRHIDGVVARWPELAQQLHKSEPGDPDLSLALGPAPPRHYDCRITPLNDRRRRQIGRLILLHDITERKRAESELRRRMKELEVSNEQLDAFAHTAAHDLKGPLSTMSGFVEMIDYYLDELTTEEIREHLDSLRTTGRRMAEIVDALLLLARVHRQADLSIASLDMLTIVQGALEQVDPLVVSSGAQIDFFEVWPCAAGYAPWVKAVWINYLSNALKYGGTPPVIELGAEVLSSESPGRQDRALPTVPGVKFWIRDNGQGLNEAQMAKLFKPFSRVHTNPAGGHGLGLAIVQRIVTRLGGQVGVESHLSTGSTFWFTLPPCKSCSSSLP